MWVVGVMGQWWGAAVSIIVCTMLIDVDADASAPLPCAQNGYTPLLLASMHGELRTVQALLAAGACVEAKSKYVGGGRAHLEESQ